MALSVRVEAFGGTVEESCEHSGIDELCKQASERGLPLLGCVDPADDTVFNRSQMRMLIPELRKMTGGVAGAYTEAAKELLELALKVEQSSDNHRYLVFMGD